MFGRGKKQPEQPTRRVSGAARPLPESFSYYRSTRRNQTMGDVRRQEIETAGRRDIVRYVKLSVIVLVLVVALGKVLYVTRSAHVQLPSDSYAYRDAATYTKIVNDGLKKTLWHGNKLTFDDVALKEYLAQQLPELQQVEIIIPLINNRPTVKLSFLQPGMVLATGKTAYVVTNTGRIVTELSQKSPDPLVPQVNEMGGTVYSIGDYGFAEASVRFINELKHQFDAKQMSITGLTIPAGSIEELRVKPTGAAYSVRFDMTGDAVAQAGNYLAAIKYMSAQGLQAKEYIDARVSGKIFFK